MTSTDLPSAPQPFPHEALHNIAGLVDTAAMTLGEALDLFDQSKGGVVRLLFLEVEDLTVRAELLSQRISTEADRYEDEGDDYDA